MDLTDDQPSYFPGLGASAATETAPARKPEKARDRPQSIFVTFNRRELETILQLYGRGIAGGLWRDYSIDHLRGVAVFAIYRRAGECPLYRIEKRPKLHKRQGTYAVIAQSGLILKRGHDLKPVLHVIDRKLWRIVSAENNL